MFLYGRARQRYDLWREETRFLATRVQEPAPNLDHSADFMVPLTTPILGGLALAADGAAAANRHHRHGVGSVPLGVLERYLPQDGVLIDIGANIGVFSVAAAKIVGEGGRVVAFEPNPLKRGVLQRNLARHRVAPIVEVLPNRLEDCNPEVGPSVAFRGKQLMAVIRVTETLQRNVDMMRISAGSGAPDVLGEAEELLDRNSQIVLLVDLEPGDLAAAGTSPADVLERLPENRWDLWVIDEHSDSQVDPLQPLDREAWPRDAERLDGRRFMIVAIQKNPTGAQFPV